MSIYEYNEEYVKKTLHEEGFDEGFDKGFDAGKYSVLVKNVESLMENLGLDLPKACQALGITTDEYSTAKEKTTRRLT